MDNQRNDEGNVAEDSRFHNPIGMKSAHIPVLLEEVIEALDPKSGKFIIDGTLGAGGHAKKIIEKLKPDGKFLGIDWDGKSVERVEGGLKSLGLDNVVVGGGNYKDIKEIIKEEELGKADGVLVDLGFSSEHLVSGRGFTFQEDEPLLMTYDEEATPLYKVLKQIKKRELGRVIRELSDEKYADKIAVAITEASRKAPIKTSGELAELIRGAVPKNYERGRIDPATRTFMALRMLVNDELGNLQKFLIDIPEILNKGGRAVIISFHSGEDRIVKNGFRDLVHEGSAKHITKKPVEATEKEINKNPRSRSAKLRVIEII